ncbi:MAG TPA: TonB-dependent receptor, partial [Luteolibacter sp.]
QRTGFDAVEDLPIYNYQAIGADFFGGEIETTFHLLESVTAPVDAKSQPAATPAQQLDLTFSADYVHAEDRASEEAVPRIPPFRATAALDYQLGNFGANFETQWSACQNRTSDDELPTDSYVLVNAGIDYKLTLGEVNTTFFLKGVNLFDQEARQSTSFLKDIVPLAGRGVVVGLRSEF